jgi:hypothetical protein
LKLTCQEIQGSPLYEELPNWEWKQWMKQKGAQANAQKVDHYREVHEYHVQWCFEVTAIGD